MKKHHKVVYKPNYQVGLGDSMLFRSRIIFLILIIIVTVSLGSAFVAAVKSGAIRRNIIDPAKQVFSSIGESFKQSSQSAQPNYGTIINISNTTGTSTVIKNSPTPTPTKTPIQKPQPAPITPIESGIKSGSVISNCTRRQIREGEFASNKCYSQQDYEDLNYYLNQYNSAVSSVSFYQTKVNISCSNNDFFKTCEQDKKDQQANLDNIPRSKSIIQGIIARGK